MKKSWRRLGATALSLLCLWGSALAEPIDKLDAILKTAVSHGTEGVRQRAPGVQQDKILSLLVKVNDGGRELSQKLPGIGGRVTSTHGNILSLKIPVDSLMWLASLDSVIHLEAAQVMGSELDQVSLSTGVNHGALIAAHPRATGRGVLVGILDTGADTQIPAFRDTEGVTRIKFFWEQFVDDPQRRPSVTLPGGGSTTFDTGAEYTADDIQNEVFVDPDNDAHGTHVAGIAAGRDDQFPGMAPESDLLVVRNSGLELFNLAQTGPTLDAYTYLASRRDELGLPMVVNQSQGSLMGPHDGSSLFEQALQSDIENRNLIICISAGNDQLAAKHALETLPANGEASVDLGFEQNTADFDSILYNSVDMWFDPGSEPELTVELYSDPSFTTLVGASSAIPFADTGTFNIPNSPESFTLEKELPSNLNGDNRFFLTFSGPENLYFYRLRFRNTTGVSQTIDLYTQRNTQTGFFTDVASASGTLGFPGTTPGAITVGAFTTRTSYLDVNSNLQPAAGNTLFDLAPFSSIGPPRNLNLYTGLNSTKPDLCAPGDAIISQLPPDCDCEDSTILEGGEYLVFSGTSMSSPVVAGVVALMLQDNPIATPAQIKAWLLQATRSDAFTGVTPNDRWGHGKLDALAAFEAVVSPQPIFSGLEDQGQVDANFRQLRLLGERFALSSEVLLDGVAMDASLVDWRNHREIVVQVPTGTHFSTITVLNLKAPAGSQTASFTLREAGSNTEVFLEDSSGGFCFIATAAYGSPLEPHVGALRRFRDNVLLTNAPGQAFVSAYYEFSPSIARFISAHESLRVLTRIVLTPVVMLVCYPLWSLSFMLLALVAMGLLWKRLARRGGFRLKRLLA